METSIKQDGEGHVEALEAGVFTSDLPCKFKLVPGFSNCEFGLLDIFLIGKAGVCSLDLSVALCLEDLNFYAVKKIGNKNKETLESFMKEAAVMQQLGQNQSIVTFHEFIEYEESEYIVTENVAGKNLGDILEGNEILEVDFSKESSLKSYHLQQRNIVHRDIKPENLMITDDHTVKIIDFGSSKEIIEPGEELRSCCGSPKYMAPERVTGDGMNQKLHSLDFVSLFSGKIVLEIKPGRVQRLMNANPKNRLKLQKIEVHPWICVNSKRDRTYPDEEANQLERIIDRPKLKQRVVTDKENVPPKPKQMQRDMSNNENVMPKPKRKQRAATNKEITQPKPKHVSSQLSRNSQGVMRAVIQRVLRASVTVDNEVISKIERGLCVLIGITVDDTEKDLEYMFVNRSPVLSKPKTVNNFRSANKLMNIRLFEDPKSAKPWSKSAKDLSLEILCVSQFTLYGYVLKGNKPDFHLAMKSDLSREYYSNFLNRMKELYHPEKVKDGVFGAMMQVDICNDGPVTIQLDSRITSKKSSPQPTPQTDEEVVIADQS
ncbi:D-tyrosyl-tRNA(Tyr) deacylase [Nowakowskiella sp. JEL0407]|nr:D-tyrosyl-tRNA(Tyr) deacylase [Nowakowskiella sp. JEL0407]